MECRKKPINGTYPHARRVQTSPGGSFLNTGKKRKETYKMNTHKTYTNTLKKRERKTHAQTMEIAKYGEV